MPQTTAEPECPSVSPSQGHGQTDIIASDNILISSLVITAVATAERLHPADGPESDQVGGWQLKAARQKEN